MVSKKTQPSAAFLLLLFTSTIWADEPSEIFLTALNHGESIAPLLVTQETAPVIQAMQQSTGDHGSIMIHAHLIQRFVQQSHCGRIEFWLEQPSSKHIWPQIGGQFNICEDGLPPWRLCEIIPNVLVPPANACPDGRPSRDTPEVQAAITESLKKGSLSREQVMGQLQKQNAGVPHQ